ncbi:MAG: hypothetical protein GPJ54_21915 [Candidatus Heimdallarchaeota archaeon]|nr:hypothetical protein [Candidatus Heimdallarchaeota archaeon]
MRLAKINIFFAVMIICLFAGSTFAQSDDYYYESEIKYSDKLKAGMEFTWEISKYSVEIPSDKLGLDQAATTVTSTVDETTYVTTTAPPETSTTVYTSYETTTWDDSTTTTYTEDISYPNFPDIAVGTTITIKLLKDLSNFTQYYFTDNSDYDDYQTYVDSFFEMSYSAGTQEEMKNFIPAEALIGPNTVVFENGTVMNLFELQVLEYERYQDEYEDEDSSSTFEVKDGIAIQTESYNDPDRNETSSLNIQYDIDTGLLVYVYSELRESDTHFEIEVKLQSSEGLDVNNLVANDDPTLSVPISAIYVYTLILVPIVVNRIRKKK